MEGRVPPLRGFAHKRGGRGCPRVCGGVAESVSAASSGRDWEAKDAHRMSATWGDQVADWRTGAENLDTDQLLSGSSSFALICSTPAGRATAISNLHPVGAGGPAPPLASRAQTAPSARWTAC